MNDESWRGSEVSEYEYRIVDKDGTVWADNLATMDDVRLAMIAANDFARWDKGIPWIVQRRKIAPTAWEEVKS